MFLQCRLERVTGGMAWRGKEAERMSTVPIVWLHPSSDADCLGASYLSSLCLSFPHLKNGMMIVVTGLGVVCLEDQMN